MRSLLSFVETNSSSKTFLCGLYGNKDTLHIFACTAKMQELLLIDCLLVIILQKLLNRPVLVLRLSFGPNILYDQWQKDTSNRFLN